MDPGPVAHVSGNTRDIDYSTFLFKINERFGRQTAEGKPLFQTNASKRLPRIFLDGFEEADRQYHNCHACKDFLSRFGGIVTVDPTGHTKSALWDLADAPGPYKKSIAGIIDAVESAPISTVFYSDRMVWGKPVTGQWTHFSVVPREKYIYKNVTMTPKQAMARKVEEFRAIFFGMKQYPHALVKQAVSLLESDALYRSEKVLGHALWLHHLHLTVQAAPRELKTNAIWSVMANAPAGFAYPASSMIGTLLDDIKAGYDFYTIDRRFRKKMDPTVYRRPSAQPTDNQIDAAEKLAERMGIQASLQRRYARLEEINTVWLPKTPWMPEKAPGVFGSLKGGIERDLIVSPARRISWIKFKREVLPGAIEMTAFCPGDPSPYAALTTAVNPDAPPILQWDLPEDRNPVAWYLYASGSLPSQWGLEAGSWVPVTGIALNPSMLASLPMEHIRQSVFFILEGARDKNNVSLALFPETLKSELHELSRVIEAYSRAQALDGYEEATACGVDLIAGTAWNFVVEIKNEFGKVRYKLDRWD